MHHHTNTSAFTILLQDDVGELQVFLSALWYHVPPTLAAFVINIGDMVQVWSIDTYTAALHRVEPMDQVVDRFSIPFFFNPSYETVVQPLECARDAIAFQPIRWGEYRRKRADGDPPESGERVQISSH